MPVDPIPTETRQERTDREKAEGIIEKAESLVLHPATHSKVVSVGGKTLTLRPLPIAVAKKINRSVKSVYDKVQNMATASQESDMIIFMEELGTSLEFVMTELLSFYNATDLTPIDEKLSVQEILYLIDAQVEVNSENDFLLNSLGTISKILQAAGKRQANAISRVMSTLSSATDGEQV